MSESKRKNSSQGLSIQNSQITKMTENQDFQRDTPPFVANQQNKNQKKQEDNDYQCHFKLTIKQKYQEQLTHDQTEQIFIVIVNKIIEERIHKNYMESDQVQGVQLVQDLQEQSEQPIIGLKITSVLDKLKAEDDQIKQKIKQLMKKRPKKKGLTYELDPNRDKGIILAKRMNQVKHQREQKYIQNKKLLQEQKNQLFESQFSTINFIQNFSVHLTNKKNRVLINQSNLSKLPVILNTTNFMMNKDKFKNNQNNFFNFLNRSKSINQGQNPQHLQASRYNSLTLTYRDQHEKNKGKKRDLKREIQILRKSQKITQKYEIRKIIYELVDQMVCNSVKLVENKKQFFFNAPPKPVHEMIQNYKDKNGKLVWIPGSKPQNFRININLSSRVNSKLGMGASQNQQNGKETKRTHQKQMITSRISSISHSFQICVKNGFDFKGQSIIQGQEEVQNQSQSQQDEKEDRIDVQNDNQTQKQGQNDEEEEIQKSEGQLLEQLT